jgi:hypothetical protein
MNLNGSDRVVSMALLDQATIAQGNGEQAEEELPLNGNSAATSNGSGEVGALEEAVDVAPGSISPNGHG